MLFLKNVMSVLIKMVFYDMERVNVDSRLFGAPYIVPKIINNIIIIFRPFYAIDFIFTL